MEDYIIKVNHIEEWQTIKDTDSLDRTFDRAKRTLVGGGKVLLVRVQPSGETYRFEEYDTLEDLEAYKGRVYQYL